MTTTVTAVRAAGSALDFASWSSQVRAIVDRPASGLDGAEPWQALQDLARERGHMDRAGLSGVPVDMFDDFIAIAGRQDRPLNKKSAQQALGLIRIQLGGTYALPAGAGVHDGVLGAGFIRRADVAGFLRGSKVDHTVFHGVDRPETFTSITTSGFDVGRVERAMWGRGLYSTFVPGGWGNDTIEAAVRIKNPLVGTERQLRDTIQPWVSTPWSGRTGFGPEAAGALLQRGYDGLVVRDPKLVLYAPEVSDWAIAVRNDDIRIVVRDSDGAPDVRPPGPTRWTDAPPAD